MRECGLREVPAARTPFSNQAAATGWAWTASGAPLFPGYLSTSEGVTFESLGRVGYAAWDAVPESGKFQILGVIGILELLGEASVKPHYMSGGTPGKIPLIWDPLGFTAKLSPEALARKRNSELKNGCALGRCAHTGTPQSARQRQHTCTSLPPRAPCELRAHGAGSPAARWRIRGAVVGWCGGGGMRSRDPRPCSDGVVRVAVRRHAAQRAGGALWRSTTGCAEPGLSPRAPVRRRLAMIGVASMVSGHFIPDSVPLLPTGM